ncbi:condensation domain-containing protein [Streptomyces sp. NPDC006367]|uniref:condensation domain-containing protein n=1 Tax=unclassified Streptomyces TaxID=2593676 RepID=UPI0033A35168
MSTDRSRTALAAVLLDTLDRKAPAGQSADLDKSWVQNGGSSLEAYAAVMRIEQELGAVIPMSRLLGPAPLAELLDTAAPSEPAHQRFWEGGDAVPATASQRRHWRHAQEAGSAAFLNMGHAVRCTRDFDADRAETAFRHLITRHESLRNRYLTDADGRLLLQDVPDWPKRATFEHHPAAATPEEATAVIRAAVGRPFSLADEPPVRGGCVPLPGGEGVVYFGIHHIAADGWSTDLLAAEFLALYTEPDAELAAATPFSAYAGMLEARAAEGHYAENVAYWRSKFGRVSPDFTVARRSGEAGGQRAGSLRLSWDAPGEADAVRTAAREYGVTTYSLLLASLLASAHVLSGEDDVVVMSGVANRNSARVRDTIGLFTNQIFFVGNFGTTTAATGGIRAYVGDVHRDVVESLGRSELPVEVVLDELDAYTKAKTLAPYANILFQAADAPLDPPAIRDGSWRNHSLGTGSIKRHCNIHLVDTPGELTLELDYSLALVGESDAKRLLAAVRAGVEYLVAAPDSSVAELLAQVRQAAGEREPQLTVFTVDYPGARTEPALAAFVRDAFPQTHVVELPVPRSLDPQEADDRLRECREAVRAAEGPQVVLSYCSASEWARYLVAALPDADLRLVTVGGNVVTEDDWTAEFAELVHRLDPAADLSARTGTRIDTGGGPAERWESARTVLAGMGEALEAAYTARFGAPLGRVARETMAVQLAWLSYLGTCTVLGTLAGPGGASGPELPGDLLDGRADLEARLAPELTLPGADVDSGRS